MTAPKYVGQLGYWSLVQHADNVIAHALTATERQRAWAHIIQTEPGFADFQVKTTRVLPLFGLPLV
jgi:hypothetical protein